MNSYRVVGYFSVFLTFLFLAACSSSDGGAVSTSPAGTGRVSLLITDAPTQEFDQINITIESVTLIAADDDDDYRHESDDDSDGDRNEKHARGHDDSDEGDDENREHASGKDDDDSDHASKQQVVLFEGEKVVNLLALQNFSGLLSTSTVPVGTYSKIRLQVSKVELVRLNPDGTVESTELAKLPGNGKIDLNPRGPFRVTGDGHIMIELDIDANKSIHIVAAGKRYIFRPVIFVNILGEDDVKLVILDGKVMEKSDRGFRLCSDVSITTVDDSCLAILYSDETVVQNSAIDVVGRDSIENETMVTVLGRASIIDMHALHIVIEDDRDASQNLALFSGKATSAVDASNIFTLKTDDSNSLVSPGLELEALIVEGARIFDKFGVQVGPEKIIGGSEIDLFGLARPDLLEVTNVRSAFVIYDNSNIVDNARKVSGTIVAIDSKDEKLTVLVSADSFSGDVCVGVGRADMFLLALVDDSIASKETGIDGLATGMNVDVYTDGNDYDHDDEDDDYHRSSSDNGCLSADVVLATENSSEL